MTKTIVALSVAFAGGVALTIAGATLANLLMSTVGGAIAGATISSLIGEIGLKGLRDDFVRRVDSLLEVFQESTRNELKTDDQRLWQFRREWFIYVVSRHAGRFHWRMIVIDFSKEIVPGKLIYRHSSEGPVPTKYSYVGFVRDERLVLLATPIEGTEPVSVIVFPHAARAHQMVHGGIACIRTWDGTDAISMALISTRSLVDSSSGTIDAKLSGILNDHWLGYFSKTDTLERPVDGAVETAEGGVD